MPLLLSDDIILILATRTCGAVSLVSCFLFVIAAVSVMCVFVFGERCCCRVKEFLLSVFAVRHNAKTIHEMSENSEDDDLVKENPRQ